MHEIMETSPILRVLSGNYVLIVEHKHSKTIIEKISDGKQFPASLGERMEILDYKHIEKLSGEFVYGTKLAIDTYRKQMAKRNGRPLATD